MHYANDPAAHARIFGAAEPERGTGRSRRCRSCGDWHSLDKPWPHNCRPPQIGARQHLAAPRVAPAFDSFIAQPGSDVSEIIGSRNEKREFMKRHGLVEYAEGVADTSEWARHRDEIADIVDDIKMVDEMDDDRRKKEFGAVEMNEGGSLAEGTEIDLGGDE